MDHSNRSGTKGPLSWSAATLFLIAACAVAILLFESACSSRQESEGGQEILSTEPDSLDAQTGMVIASGFELVRANCTICHSADLVTQNRASREGWEQMIRWMQEKQGLWDLGEQEGPILDYLSTHYAPEAVGRRANLPASELEWYRLSEGVRE